MRDQSDLSALLSAMIGDGFAKQMIAPADLHDQFAAAVALYGNAVTYKVGDLVFPKKESEWKRFPGLPNVVLAVRPDAPPDYTAKERLKRGQALDLRIGIWAPIVGITAIWVSSCDFEPYDEVLHGAPAVGDAGARVKSSSDTTTEAAA